MKQTLHLFLLLFLGMALITCAPPKRTTPPPAGDLAQIKKKGVLTVLTLNRSNSYFIYRGEEMGFQYELAEQFAHSLGVKMQIKTARNIRELVAKLKRGEGDIIAYNLPFTKQNRDSVLFCGEQTVTHQVVVQRKGRGLQILTNVTQLIGKDVYVKPGRYYDRMVNLNRELGGGILIHKVEGDSINTEDLIYDVSEGKIKYAVADNDEAMLNKTYYENLDVSLSVSFDQRASWAVRRDSWQLAQEATRWYRENVSSTDYKQSMQRYFSISKERAGGHYSFTRRKISPYDALFRKYAKKIGWDWRLLAAIAYKESRFNPRVVSWAGARGLMQLMPLAAKAAGLSRGEALNPEESIKGAVRCIAMIEKQLREVKNPHERLLFVLASYNAGYGHVSDAMALASKYGKSRHRWKGNVEKYLLLKSREQYYNDPVCENGYFRGLETYDFVRDVEDYYQLFKTKARR
jgi:membrane-bound lytic murein transglycosylase F